VSRAAIYEGTIAHRRLAVRRHAFRHRIAMAYLDLGALPRRLTRRRAGLVRFRRADYLGDPAVPLERAVRDLVAQRTGRRPAGPIRLLTHLRVAGRCFNPVSFYYCFDEAERLQAVVAEVTNIPWGERHAYVLDGERTVGSEKALHVSPFFGMDQRYAWYAPAPGRTLTVRIANEEDGREVFDATLALRWRPLTARTLARSAYSSLRVSALIFAHAAALKLKGVPVHSHPDPAS
jgi:uncharacterized protein